MLYFVVPDSTLYVPEGGVLVHTTFSTGVLDVGLKFMSKSNSPPHADFLLSWKICSPERSNYMQI